MLVLVALVATELFLLQHTPYRPDVDVYRMGAHSWLDGRPLYSDSALFHTRIGMDLPFTYPPLAVVVLCPLAWLSLSAATVVITVLTLLCLVVSLAVLLARLGVRPTANAVWLGAALAVPAALLLEPIRANFSYGQINVMLMTLVIADCVPRRTPWPRGVLLGIAVALKLTPAVFLLYFILRRDGRAVLVSVASFVVATLVGFAFAWRDSWTYWTSTVQDTGRIGVPSLRTNQNITALLARLDLAPHARFVLWAAASVAVLALTVWAARRAVRAQE
ncbi:MAG TPA: glycosyltransferase family 87 protein, partial [Mycobacterium sp.]|nr:glycosyltransferase family 87 protein [Mycobacterium sp.]